METMNTTTTVIAPVETAPVNYIGQYMKKTEHDWESFFVVNSTEEDKIDEITKSIKKLTVELDEAEGKLAKEYSKKYSKKYEATKQASFLYYKDRSNNAHYYAIPSGQEVDVSHVTPTSYTYELETKSGQIEILAGFCYEMASIVIKNYKYSISADNAVVKLKLLNETLYDFLQQRSVDNRTLAVKDTPYKYTRTLRNIKGDEFISTLFNVDICLDWDLDTYGIRYRHNKSFETIIKAAQKELIPYLLNQDVDSPMAVYKIMGLSKEGYNEAIDRGLILDAYVLREYIQKKDIFNKTEHEWFDLIEQCKRYEEDLDFYSINYERGCYYYSGNRPKTSLALYSLSDIFDNKKMLKTYYSFGKYVDYVVHGVIDQGYRSIRDFTDELSDYLNMANTQGIKPILYSNSLKQTHDLTARNHAVKVSMEDEAKFQSRYTDYKDVKIDDYVIVAPTKSDDLKFEGDNLAHCCSSYIKRVIDGESLILFLRKDPAISLLTLQLKEGKIVQARGMANRMPNKEEIGILEKFAEKAKLVLAY